MSAKGKSEALSENKGQQPQHFAAILGSFMTSAGYEKPAHFAPDCRISAGYLSRLLNGKRYYLSAEMIWRISLVLTLRIASFEKWQDVLDVTKSRIEQARTNEASRLNLTEELHHTVLGMITGVIIKDYVETGHYADDAMAEEQEALGRALKNAKKAVAEGRASEPQQELTKYPVRQLNRADYGSLKYVFYGYEEGIPR